MIKVERKRAKKQTNGKQKGLGQLICMHVFISLRIQRGALIDKSFKSSITKADLKYILEISKDID